MFTALGFQPSVEVDGGDGHSTCTLGNCPYRESVRESPEVICTLHRGITEGILDQIDPAVRLARFEPKDPDHAGCVVGVVSAQLVVPDAVR